MTNQLKISDVFGIKKDLPGADGGLLKDINLTLFTRLPQDAESFEYKSHRYLWKKSDKTMRGLREYSYMLGNELIKEIAKIKPDEVILDSGCGHGFFIHDILQQFPHLRIIGINDCDDDIEVEPSVSSLIFNIDITQLSPLTPNPVKMIISCEGSASYDPFDIMVAMHTPSFDWGNMGTIGIIRIINLLALEGVFFSTQIPKQTIRTLLDKDILERISSSGYRKKAHLTDETLIELVQNYL